MDSDRYRGGNSRFESLAPHPVSPFPSFDSRIDPFFIRARGHVARQVASLITK